MKANSATLGRPQRNSSEHILNELLSDQEWVIIQLRNDFEEFPAKNKEASTADFLSGLIEQHKTTPSILETSLN